MMMGMGQEGAGAPMQQPRGLADQLASGQQQAGLQGNEGGITVDQVVELLKKGIPPSELISKGIPEELVVQAIKIIKEEMEKSNGDEPAEGQSMGQPTGQPTGKGLANMLA